MNSGDGDVELLSRAILNEAQSEAQDLQADAQSKASDVRQRAQAEAEQQRKEILEQAQREAARLRSQAIATAQLKARSGELAHREKLLIQVFEAAERGIEFLTQRKDYGSVAMSLLREGVAQMNAPAIEVRMDAATAKHLTASSLESVGKEMHVSLSVGEALQHGTGLVLQTPDGHLQFDNTLETRLARMRSNLRAAVYEILTGGAK